MLFLVAGIGIGWLIRHLLAARSSTEQSTLFNKLPSETREVILADNRKTLTTVELVHLIDERIFEPIREEALPYIACPSCGSKDVTTQNHDSPSMDENPYYTIHCNACTGGAEPLPPVKRHWIARYMSSRSE